MPKLSVLTVRHVTVYRYSVPVKLGEHRMMFRPRASHDLKLLRTSLCITPNPSRLRWLHDVFDNSIAIAEFDCQASELRFESMVTLEHSETTLPEYVLEGYASNYPFQYSEEDAPDLCQALAQHYPSENVWNWAKQFLDSSGVTGTMSLLHSMTLGIRKEFLYTRRIQKGIQSPDETFQCRSGSCRDFAVLLMEAARSLGVAARFVSGYIFVPGDDTSTTSGGATHAWMQAYLPGAGWIDFDPTNCIVGNRNLIRVAVAWAPENVLPLWGTFTGPSNSFLGMDVTVGVTEESYARVGQE